MIQNVAMDLHGWYNERKTRNGVENLDRIRLFRASSLDTSGVGLWTDYPYAGTLPMDAEIIGWARPEVIAFCFLPGQEERVFLLDLAAPQNDQVRSVAANFTDFLGLLVACGTVNGIFRLLFDRNLFPSEEPQPRTKKQQSILRAISNTFAPSNISDPAAYLAAQPPFPGTGEEPPAPPKKRRKRKHH